MLFIFIPLGLILISTLGIIIVVSRKIPYLKKLNPEEIVPLSENSYDFGWKLFISDFFPEIDYGTVNLKIKEYKDLWLGELEKFIRKLRLISLKIDRASDTVIKKIRKVNRKEIIVQSSEVASSDPDLIAGPPLDIKEPETQLHKTEEFIKSEEQRIIIEIAKDPKNGELYKELGELYIEMKSFQDAKDSFQAALELRPDDEDLKKRASFVESQIKSQGN